MMMNLRSLRLLFLLFVSCGLSGCAVEWLGMKLLFDQASLPERQVLRDIAYVEENAHPEKHRFDLYLPRGEDWPTLVFVHGGSWAKGDKDLKSGGFAVYGNIGAFYAGQGVGVAVINYRLQPEVSWRDQVRDVARAVARVRREVVAHGGNPQALFMAGHSAGAQLATFTAVADWPLQEVEDSAGICGVVAVSGAGYDLADEETYELGADPEFYEKIFHHDEAQEGKAQEGKAQEGKAQEGKAQEGWAEEASATSYLDAGDPPFLVFYAGRETPALQHQARLLDQRLKALGVASRLVVVPRQGHSRIVVTLSQGKHPMTAEVLRFIVEQKPHCGKDRGALIQL